MHLFLEVTSGPAVGRKLHLKTGQSARIGRTEWADFAIHEDPDLSEIHFLIECGDEECRIRDLDSASGTLLDDKPLAGTQILLNGAQIKAGQTVFLAKVDETGLASFGTPASAVPAESATSTAPAMALDALMLCEKLSLSETAKQVARAGTPPGMFAVQLLQVRSYADALRVVSFTLPKQTAITWGAQQVRATCANNLTGADQSALRAAETWAKDPTDTNRRAAKTAADETQLQTAPGWVAMAAFWSGGSLTEPHLPPVPPGEALTCQALTGSLLMAAAVPPATQMANRFETYLRAGIALLGSPA